MQGLFLASEQCDEHSGGGQVLCQGFTDSTCGAGHDGDPSAQWCARTGAGQSDLTLLAGRLLVLRSCRFLPRRPGWARPAPLRGAGPLPVPTRRHQPPEVLHHRVAASPTVLSAAGVGECFPMGVVGALQSAVAEDGHGGGAARLAGVGRAACGYCR